MLEYETNEAPPKTRYMYYGRSLYNARIPFYSRKKQCWISFDVEFGVPASDICNVLTRDQGNSDDPRWTLVENIYNKNLRRIVDDHEEVISFHKKLLNFSEGTGKLVLEYLPNKASLYDLETLMYYPYIWFKKRTLFMKYFTDESQFCFVMNEDNTITFLTKCFYKKANSSINVWEHQYLLLHGRSINIISHYEARHVIENNKAILQAIQTQMKTRKSNDIGFLSSNTTRPAPDRSTPPILSLIFSKTRGLNARRAKVYYRIDYRRGIETPTRHFMTLMEEVEDTLCYASDDELVDEKPEIQTRDNATNDEENRINHFSLSCWKPTVFDKIFKKPKETPKELKLEIGEELYVHNTCTINGNEYKEMLICLESEDLMKLWMDILRVEKYGEDIACGCRRFLEKLSRFNAQVSKKDQTAEHTYVKTFNPVPEEPPIEDNASVPCTSKQVQQSIVDDSIQSYDSYMQSTSHQSPNDPFSKEECVPNTPNSLETKLEADQPTDSDPVREILKEESKQVPKKKITIKDSHSTRMFNGDHYVDY